MIHIQVIAHNGMPPMQLVTSSFDELGGNIGRAEGNVLILSDPGRSISRIHASVVFRGGNYFIRGLGSTMPVYLNDQPLNNGHDTLITDGDRIRIGDYVMQVMDTDHTAKHRSFETVMSQTSASLSDHAENQSLADLIALPEEQIQSNSSALKAGVADLMPEAHSDPLDHMASLPQKSTIPTDFDPFAISVSVEEQNKFITTASTSNHNDLDEFHRLLESQERQPNIDNVINPTPSLMDFPASSNKNSIDDPLVALAEATANSPKAEFKTHRNDTPELNASLPPMRVYEPAVESNAAFEPADSSNSTGFNQEELLQAFLSGAGLSNLDKPIELTPQLMNQVGQLLRMSTQGTLDLLVARALMKREMRAEMTMIKPRENNPLKLSPNVEAALMHLLFPKTREQGFMPPLAAMKDAYNDLRSHQFGFMAGMRVALSGILGRFNPTQLEKRLGQKTLVDSVFSLNRKANLWDMFTDRYSDIFHEAEEDFHVMFGKEFLRAYEAQIAKLEMEDKKP